jgi:phosphatidylserine/phosphatidylglycerophosphate/cardiolipin synthase-like enzyme
MRGGSMLLVLALSGVAWAAPPASGQSGEPAVQHSAAKAGKGLAQSVRHAVQNLSYWGGLALRPVPRAVAEGISKRWRGAIALDALLRDDLSKMEPEALAEQARTLLYANPKQRLQRRADLRTALRRVLDAYAGDHELGAAKTDVLLSRMVLSEQNAHRAARRLGRHGVAEIEAKLEANRIDPQLPREERIAELKRRLALDNGAPKLGTMSFVTTGEAIQQTMLGQLAEARAIARGGQPAYYVFSTYALEDDSPGHEVGATFARALRQAADDGVVIVGLYDRFGSKSSGVEHSETRRAFFEELSAHQSSEGARRIQLVHIADSPLISHGSHQKWSIVAPGLAPGAAEQPASAMVQDANLGSLYQGKNAPWQDTAARLEGPVVEDVGTMAIERLRANGYQPSDAMVKALTAARALPAGARPIDLTILNHVAGRDLRNKRLVLNSIDAAGKGDVIEWSQPYGQDDDVTDALVRAARDRKVEVHLVYDRHNNQPTVAAAARDTYARFLGAGVHVHEYGSMPGSHDVDPSTKVFSHAKVMLIKFANGVRLAALGSSNGDNRSFGDEPAAGVLTGNDESVTFTFDARQVAEIERKFMRPQLERYSVPITPGEARLRLRDRIGGWLLDQLRGFN